MDLSVETEEADGWTQQQDGGRGDAQKRWLFFSFFCYTGLVFSFQRDGRGWLLGGSLLMVHNPAIVSKPLHPPFLLSSAALN